MRQKKAFLRGHEEEVRAMLLHTKVVTESLLEWVNRRNLKNIKFEHKLHLGFALE